MRKTKALDAHGRRGPSSSSRPGLRSGIHGPAPIGFPRADGSAAATFRSDGRRTPPRFSSATPLSRPPIIFLAFVASCGDDPTDPCCAAGDAALRIVNAFTTPVDVLIDGNEAITALAAGAIDSLAPSSGSHVVELRPSGSGTSASLEITITDGALRTVAVVRAANGTAGTAVLDDTSSVVPAGATKVRVLHLAPNAGTLQVYRTQPDYQQPVSWQVPFEYQPEPNALTAPFYQSTVGSWEIRIWQTPADVSGWANAVVKVVIPLGSGEKRTVLILDDPGGGVRIELL